MKKIKYNRILDLVFWSIIIVLTFIELYNGGLKTFNISELQNIKYQEITAIQYITFILAIFFVILISVIISMVKVFYLTIIYFGIKIANKKYYKDRIENIDLKNDNYYRDLLPKYSPAVLSYIDDFNINKSDIVATLLLLELKNKIKIKTDGIVLLDDTINELEENEQYILNKVKEKSLKNINILEFTNVVRKDALKKGLLQEKQGVKEYIKRKITINIIIYLFILIFFSLVPSLIIMNSNNIVMLIGFILLIILFALLVFLPYSTIIYISHYKTLNTLDPYIRNDEGKVINLKLEGFRKFLIEFSQIEEKTKEQLILWEEYLVYSVMLGINTKVVEEIYNNMKNN